MKNGKKNMIIFVLSIRDINLDSRGTSLTNLSKPPPPINSNNVYTIAKRNTFYILISKNNLN